MKKYFIYITKPEQEFNVYGHELFFADDMLCCPDPVLAIPCKLGDTFTVVLKQDEYGEEQFYVNAMCAPKSLNSFVAWLCGFSTKRRCPAWRYKYMRKNFTSHAHHPGEETTLDERIIDGKLSMAVVRYADTELPCTRLWAGIDCEPLTAEDILTVCDLFVHRVRSAWVVLKLKDYGVDIDLAELRKARYRNEPKRGGEPQ